MTQHSNNIVVFPSRMKGPVNNRQVVDSINTVRYNHVNETLDMVVPQLLNNIELAGFPVTGNEETLLDSDKFEQNIKSCSLIVEAVRAVLMKHYDMYHPFQVLAQQAFVKNIEGYGLTPKLDINFEQLEQENSYQDK